MSSSHFTLLLPSCTVPILSQLEVDVFQEKWSETQAVGHLHPFEPCQLACEGFPRLTSSSRDPSDQGQRHMAAGIPPSFTSHPTSGDSGATRQQNIGGQPTPGSFTSISEHSHYAALGNGVLGPPQSFITTSTVQSSNGQGHALVGLTTPSLNTGQGQYRSYLPPLENIQQAYNCPYHGPILQGRLADPRYEQGRSVDTRYGQGPRPMDRYLAEGPSEQYALLHHADTGKLSTYRGCRCYELMQGNVTDLRMRHH